MKKIRIILIALFAALTMCGASVVAFADDGVSTQYTVTYKVFTYNDQIRKVSGGAKAENLPLSEFHFKLNEGLFTDELYAMTWYTDPAFNDSYDFNAAVSSDITLYGKVTENTKPGDIGSADVFGWNENAADVYYQDNELSDKRVMGLNCINPLGVSADGNAEFSFGEREGSVYYNGIDVTRPFSITVDFDDVNNYYGESTFSMGLYPSLSLAQISSMYPYLKQKSPYEDAGFMSMIHFWFNINGNDNNKEQIGKVHNTGYYAQEASPRTTWADTDASEGNPFSAKLKKVLEEESKVTFEYHIGETESYAMVKGERLVEMECKQSDFPDGVAYLAVLAERGASGMFVKVEQALGNVTAKVKDGDKHVTVANAAVNNGFVTADITLDKGYTLKATIGGVEVKTAKLTNGKYAVGMPHKLLTEDFTVEFSSVAESTNNGGGCGSNVVASSSAVLSLIVLLIAGVAVVWRKKKGEQK